jgi:hypothetical protein
VRLSLEQPIEVELRMALDRRIDPPQPEPGHGLVVAILSPVACGEGPERRGYRLGGLGRAKALNVRPGEA